MPELPTSTTSPSKKNPNCSKLTETPASCRYSGCWFQQQLQQIISEAIVPYNHLDHVLQPWQPSERWQTWPPTFWSMMRIWKVARIVCALPILTHQGSKFLSLLATCPFCGDAVVGIRHFVEHCVHMQDIRSPVLHLAGGSCELSMILC